MKEAPKPKRMDLMIGSMHYIDYINSLLGDEGRLVAMDRFLSVPSTPDNLTPRVFQNKILQMRKVREELEKIRHQLLSARMVPDRKLRYLSEEIDLMSSHLRANDPDVRSGRNIKEQDALVAEKIQDLLEEQSMYRIVLSDIDLTLDVLKYKVADAKDAQYQMRALEKVWSDEKKGSYGFGFGVTGDDNPLPEPYGMDENSEPEKRSSLDDLDDLELDDELSPDGDVDTSRTESKSEPEDRGPEGDEPNPDDPLDSKVLPTELSEEDISGFLDLEEQPKYTDSLTNDRLDEMLEDFDFEDFELDD